ncbi:MAG: hypothetical protein Ct9H300mP23_11860 [Nitrospinota bacterium]|nr:MAG: hypothetical protein Ct9H300mP23_11860 [Nitrospinota bacterium]
MRALAESKNLNQLIALYLENNNITDQGVRYISKSKTLIKLESFKFVS